jgi:hypothetical protein
MEHEKHPLNLGMLLVNFQSLEFALRMFLWNTETPKGKQADLVSKLLQLNEGDIVPMNAYTNYDSLVQLIDKYNNNPKITSAGLAIDKTLVDIRDALAHGRVAGLTPNPPFKLTKFNMPNKNNQVKVKFSALLTEEWFREQHQRVKKAVLTVTDANQRLTRGTL